MNTLRMALALGAAVAALGLGSAHAATPIAIPRLFNTGTDANNVALVGGNGVTDPHYSVLSSTFPGVAGHSAVTFFSPTYAAEDADSRWVSYAAAGHTPSTVTLYRVSFDLTGFDPATARISGKWGADNAIALFLNGSFTGNTLNNVFATLADFSVNLGFRSGVNILDFQVADSSPPTAFRIDNFVGNAVSTLPPPPPPPPPVPGGVPEPATWAMMLIGFFGAGGLLRSRRNRLPALA